jgi:hypothetical protein
MHQADPLWGAPRIHGELLKLGIAVAQSTVARYLPRPHKPRSQTWRTFLTNHLEQTAAIDFFIVPTATFRVLFVFVVLSHKRRRVVHFGVTEHPTQEWTIQRMREASPWDQAPRYVLRDRDAIPPIPAPRCLGLKSWHCSRHFASGEKRSAGPPCPSLQVTNTNSYESCCDRQHQRPCSPPKGSHNPSKKPVARGPSFR